jgi:hypothetical protein
MLPVQPAFRGFLRSARHTDSVTRDLCALLDTLVALRMDLGHDANGTAASPVPGPSQMREIRLILDGAIVLTKDIIGTECPPDGA